MALKKSKKKQKKLRQLKRKQASTRLGKLSFKLELMLLILLLLGINYFLLAGDKVKSLIVTVIGCIVFSLYCGFRVLRWLNDMSD